MRAKSRNFTGRRGPKTRIGLLWLPVLLLVLAIFTLRARAARKTVWCFQLGTETWRISEPYGERADPFTGQTAFHAGIDLACAEGTAVLAAQSGVVTAAAASTSYGNYLHLLHPDGTETRYAHLQYLYVRPGEMVQAGQVLGTVGQTGRATGPHLHLELWQQGSACDPTALVEAPA